ncbi:hypothetical protein M0802_001556 [Mischocyttarus mexicanus]|nr:hypothetical protein M0802_001556 [Mischocyttarus mexicanus]
MVSSLTLMMIDDDGEPLEVGLWYEPFCVTEPAHVREMSKGNSRRNVNDPTNDYVDTDLPIFEPTAPNVTAFVGQTVYLPCRVRKLADKVSSKASLTTLSKKHFRYSMTKFDLFVEGGLTHSEQVWNILTANVYVVICSRYCYGRGFASKVTTIALVVVVVATVTAVAIATDIVAAIQQ